MTQTPGELLTAELKKRGIKKAELARTTKKSFQTIFNWCKDRGFGPDQRKEAARAIGESPGFFDHPDLAAQRENYRQAVLQKFRSHKVGRTLTEEEWRSIESFKWPEEVAPSESRYWGLVLVIRGQLSQSELQDTVDVMEQASQQVADRRGNASDAAGPAKKPRKKARSTKAPR
jgi:hypothetical protein